MAQGRAGQNRPRSFSTIKRIPATNLMEAFTVLILTLMLVRDAFSEHKVCSWVIGVGSPERYGYYEFCVGSIKNNTGTTAEYRCPDDQKLRKNLLVADWGKLGAQILEWGKSKGAR